MPNDTAKRLQLLRKTALWIGWSVLAVCLVHALMRTPSIPFYIALAVGIAFLWLGYELRALEFHRKHTHAKWYQLGFLSIAYTLIGVIKGGRFVNHALRRPRGVDYRQRFDDSEESARQRRWHEQMSDYQQGHSPWSPD